MQARARKSRGGRRNKGVKVKIHNRNAAC